MPFPYAYYTDNYDGPIHATRFKAKGYVSLPSSEITTDGDVDALEQSVLVFNSSAANLTINSLLNVQNGQIIQIVKLTPANSITLKNISGLGAGSKFYTSTGSDIVFPSGSIGSAFFTAIQDGSTLKLIENKNNVFGDGTEAFPGISFGSDVSTGIRKISNGISFSLSGVENFKVTTAQARMTALGVASSDAIVGANVPANGIFSEGSIKTNGQFLGTATSAMFADLAERYEADQVLPVGTIVTIGGEKEITIARDRFDVFGIISKDPGFKLNADAGSDDTHPYVALAGKTPCRVIGKIKKGDKIALFPNRPGVGWKAFTNDIVIARALEDKETEEEGLVMVITKAVI